MRVAFFGGAFDPPHRAHVGAIEAVLRSGEIDRVLVVPVFQHAFGKSMAPFEHRLAMCRLAFGALAGAEISDVERALPHPNRTLDTLQALRAQHADWALRLMVGADALYDKEKWHAFDEIAELAPLLVLGRVGVAHPEAPSPVLPDISATKVREDLRGVDSESDQRLLTTVPKAVLDYVRAHGLYA